MVVPFPLTPFTDVLRQQLAIQQPRILTTMPPMGGVLIHIGIHEENSPESEEKPGQHLVTVEVLGTGRIASLVVSVSQSIPRTTRRAPRGWSSKSLYLWAVRA
jgi:hypothetical protein